VSWRLLANTSVLVKHLSIKIDIKKLKIQHRYLPSSFSNIARCTT